MTTQNITATLDERFNQILDEYKRDLSKVKSYYDKESIMRMYNEMLLSLIKDVGGFYPKRLSG